MVVCLVPKKIKGYLNFQQVNYLNTCTHIWGLICSYMQSSFESDIAGSDAKPLFDSLQLQTYGPTIPICDHLCVCAMQIIIKIVERSKQHMHEDFIRTTF